MKTIIIGGVAAGASTAARLRRLREHDEIILLEKGAYISYANCGLPYHLSGVIEQRKSLLVQTPQAFTGRFCVDVRTQHEAIKADFQNKRILIVDHVNGIQYEESYDHLVLAPGASPLRPPFLRDAQGLPVFTLNDIPDMDRIKAQVESSQAKRAIIVGGGFIGLEAAENLREMGLEVRIIEMANQLLPAADWEMALMIRREMEAHGIQVHTGESVRSVTEGQGCVHAETDLGAYDADVLICAVGVAPNTQWLRETGLEMNARGAILTDDHMRTNMDGVYAAGDAVEVKHFIHGKPAYIPLAGPANKQGRIIADNIAGINRSYKGTQGSMILKVFDKTFAMTGLKETLAENHEKVYVEAKSHAGYYPNASGLWIKLIFDRSSGRVLGAQAFGREGVDKRVDVIAAAIRAGMTADDITELELCYAPPFGSAKDPVNMAAYAAQNILNGLVDVVHGDIDEAYNPDTQMILDVRTAKEYEKGHMKNSVHIPVHELRTRMQELPKDKQIIIHCASGLRSYIACRMLGQNGFNCVNLSGGYNLYKILYGGRKS